MNDKDPKPQPWHEADEKPASKGRNSPLGTHSFTGGGAVVGMPATPEDPAVERSRTLLDEDDETLREPRAGGDDLPGRKPR